MLVNIIVKITIITVIIVKIHYNITSISTNAFLDY